MSSFSSRILYKILKKSKLNQKLKIEIDSGKLDDHPRKVPSQHMIKSYQIKMSTYQGNIVYDWNHNDHHQQVTIFYMHGGAYVHGLSQMHYRLFKTLIKWTGCRIVVPDYPLVPHASTDDIYGLLIESYMETIKTSHPSHIIFMGDSAGGGLALGLAQQLVKNHNLSGFHVMLLSPWLDVSMTDDQLKKIQVHDPILNIESLKQVGKMYARDLSVYDPKLSPLYGRFEGIDHISIWTGTKDILYADALRLNALMENRSLHFHMHIYEDMLHTWMFFGIPESKKAIHEMIHIILQRGTTHEKL